MIKYRLCIIILLIVFTFSACGAESAKLDLIETQDKVVTHFVLSENNIGNTEVKEKEITHSYIANKNTYKLHYAGCYSVDRMKESNKVYMNCTRSEVLACGYTPCQNCNP